LKDGKCLGDDDYTILTFPVTGKVRIV